MKIPVKRCTLCGALVADCPEDVALHRKFHERTAARPVRRPPPLEEPSRRPPAMTRPGWPHAAPAVIEEPSRRPAPMAGETIVPYVNRVYIDRLGSPLPRRRKADAEDEPRAMYASPVRKDLGPQFGS